MIKACYGHYGTLFVLDWRRAGGTIDLHTYDGESMRKLSTRALLADQLRLAMFEPIVVAGEDSLAIHTRQTVTKSFLGIRYGTVHAEGVGIVSARGGDIFTIMERGKEKRLQMTVASGKPLICVLINQRTGCQARLLEWEAAGRRFV
jgi:hypothetical protein